MSPVELSVTSAGVTSADTAEFALEAPVMDMGVRGRAGSAWTRLSQLSFAHSCPQVGSGSPRGRETPAANLRSTTGPEAPLT